MRAGTLLIQLIFLGLFAVLMLPSFMAETEPKDPCIIEKKRWCDEHQRQEVLWKIKGHWYLTSESPNGYHEIEGLDTRFH